MKHVAKHQKRAQVTVQTAVVAENGKGKTKKVKNPILQTYFTSLFSLILCVSMFFGTSLAWFSSEVQNTGNQIMIGTLEAELWMGEKSLSGDGVTTTVFEKDIKWEPGYTALRALTVKNTGELDFTYTLTLTYPDSTLTDEEKALQDAIAKNFVVYAKTGDCTGTDVKPADFEALTAKGSGWEPVMVNMNEQATLADILEYGLTVFRGSVNAKDTKDATETFTIALHMKEGAESGEGTSTIMGETLALNVKLVAYQKTTGAGDLADAASDAGTFVSTYVDLQKALNDSGTVILAKDLVLDKALELLSEKNVTLDLNGHKLITSGFDVSGELIVVDSRTGGTISAGEGWNSVFQIQKDGSLVLESGTIGGCAIRFLGDGSFTMNGGEINSNSSAIVVGKEGISAVATVDLNSGKITVDNSSYVVYVENGSVTAETDTEVTIEYGEGAKFDNVTSNTAETETETESETETEAETETEGAEGTEPVDASESE